MTKRQKNKPSLLDEWGLTNPHRLVLHEVSKLDTLRGNKALFALHWTPLHKRLVVIQDALLKAAERRGHRIEQTSGSIAYLEMLIAGERIRYGISEQLLRQRVPLSKKELKAAIEQGKRRRWKTIEEKTGLLVIAASGLYRGIGKGTWEDQPGKPMEEQIDSVLRGFEAVAAEAAVQRAEDNAIEAAEEKRREMRAASRRVEQERWEEMNRMMVAYEKAQRLRRFINRITEHAPMRPDQERRVRKWARWARARADHLDPMSKGLDDVLKRLAFL